MYGQMTAGSWIYIGTQGILQGTFETFAAVATKRFNGTLAGTLTVTAGLGGMGGAQPLAVTMNDGVALCIEVDRRAHPAPHREPLPRRAGDALAHALELAVAAQDERRPLSVGVVGNAAEMLPELLRARSPDRHRHRPDLGARPAGVPAGRRCLRGLGALRSRQAGGVHRPGAPSMAAHVEAMVGFLDRGAEVFDYGNSIRGEAQQGGYDRAFEFPGFVPAYIRPLFCEGKGPFRWAALSGDPADIATTDEAILELFPENEQLRRWIKMAGERVAVPGPAGPDLLARLRRAAPGRPEVQRDGRLRRAVRADRDRPRPPRLRLGGLAVPRDRGDARRLRRDRRLAAAQRPGQHRVRRDLGVASTTAAASASAARSTPAR